MNLNTLSPDAGSKRPRRRVGRGIGSGLGKTCGKGHKGQKARSGGMTKINFEGGQMPIQRRLPKMGFKSKSSQLTDQITLSELELIDADIIDLEVLKAAHLVNGRVKQVKIILSGEIHSAKVIKGIKVTKGAEALIIQAGGSIEA